MQLRLPIMALCAVTLAFFATSLAQAASETYNTFTTGAQVKRGLFPIWQKGGKTYLELAPNQLDTDYFETIDSAKAFSQNDVITVSQTWTTNAGHVIDSAPDVRRLKIDVVYNFVQLLRDDYRARLADDRVGIYNDNCLDFANERRGERKMRYLNSLELRSL